MPRSLDGIRVIDLSHVLAAPTTTMILADLGAEVIHVEPPHGDDAREFGPFAGEVDKNLSGYFISLNRNKKGIVLNLKHQKAKDILIEMIKKSDVVIENFRPTTMKKMGLHWEDLKKINPGIIYCSICGFGHDSLPEYAERPSYDMVAQAYSGLMSITGPEGGPPCRVGSSVGDIISGMQATIGILAALRYREKTGQGPARGHLHDRQPLLHAGERRRPLHAEGRDPGPPGRDPPLHHALPGLQDEGRLLHHRRHRHRCALRPLRESHRKARSFSKTSGSRPTRRGPRTARPSMRSSTRSWPRRRRRSGR